MTGSLAVDDFTKFFRALHGKDEDNGPKRFPWQQRLVHRVAETGAWPALLDLPTGSGKTAALDVAVFLLALRGDQPRRVVFVVDRRIVVHQAATRAKHIAERLGQARTGVLHTVAERLRGLAGLGNTEPPLEYAELRGGIVRDDEWVRRPDVPAVIVSTVNQVGSRLLFRGYGVSPGMRPVHAGLLGNDVLYLLDEVHLARPFAATLSAIRRHYRPPRDVHLPDRWSIVELSATPRSGHRPDQVLRLEAEDRDDPTLARRLTASKPARLRLIKVSGADQAKHREALACAAVDETRALLDQPGVRTVGVVVNRVDTAARVHHLFSGQVETLLLTGRMRPIDRDQWLELYKDRLRTGRSRDGETAPLVVVATQAVEAGADIDLDALVTECAAIDALVQRFGRVDRAGDCAKHGNPAISVILTTSADVAVTAEDPVYGDRIRRTWAWLQQQNRLDFGIEAFTIDEQTLADLSSQPDPAPLLMPSHLDRWVQTSATPDADPDPAHWLHGVQPGSPEVSVVWRADVLSGAFVEPDDTARRRIASLVSLCPPGSGEAMPLPLWAVQQWLTGLSAEKRAEVVSFSDLERADIGSLDIGTKPPAVAPALNWHGDESSVVRTTKDIRAGATLVVPAQYGGIRAGNWDPTAHDPVSDLGTAVQANQRARAVLRLYPALAVGELSVPVPEPGVDELDRATATSFFDELADQVNASDDIDPRLLDVVAALRNPKIDIEVHRVEIAPAPPDGQSPLEMFVVRSCRRVEVLGPRAELAGADSEPSTSSFFGVEVLLKQHLCDVECWARKLGHACKLPLSLVDDLALAGRLHDLGKVDPRFQSMLRKGSVIIGPQPLAKSVVSADDYRARRRAEAAAGYPRGTRHELATVALVEHDQQLRDRAHDWDLVLHLIASHHGYARPFVPVSFDNDPQRLRADVDGRVLEASSDHSLLRLDSGIPQRFWRCVRRYGWYGLAWLEAVLRLADHRASEERA